MDVIETLRARRSVRSFTAQPVDRKTLCRVLEAARIAPSAKNQQEWKFLVVQDPEKRAQLVPACANQTFVAEAPVVIACCGTLPDYTMRCGQLAYPIDVAIAIDHMTIQATAEGLGTCWIGAFYEDQVKAILGIPDGVRIVQLLILGYPAQPLTPIPSAAKKRKDLEDIVCWETWS
jgi:nitroreductase